MTDSSATRRQQRVQAGSDEFSAAWQRFVRQWADADAPARDRLVRDALAAGLGTVDPGEGTTHPVPSDAQSLKCEIAVVRASGAMDRRAYLRANPEARKRGVNPVEHFCRDGWRRLRNPSREFDVWWYWSEYLDPGEERINPLVHYLLVGQQRGCEPLQPVVASGVRTTYDEGARPSRVCLFAGFDADGLIDAYVVDYLRELSRHADVYYLSDGYIDPDELEKLADVTKGAWAIAHGAYDFGSYSMLARDLVGWDVIDEYDELVLANDSGYLLRPLDEVFGEMDGRRCDWWGLQLTRHDFDRHSNGGRPLPPDAVKSQMVGERFMNELDHLHISSYFLVYRKPVLSDPGFRRRLDGVTSQAEKVLVIYKYEIGLSRYLMCRGFDFSTFIPELHAFHPLYTDEYFDLMERGFPILKRNFLSENSRDVPGLVKWRERVLAVLPDAPVDVIERNLLRVSPDDRLRRSFSLVADRHGAVDTRKGLRWWEVVDEDRVSPTYDHWWAFPVGAHDHLLSGAQRAILEEVREDPSIKKVVLTRGRRVDVTGDNLTVLPLLSDDGQHHALRCGTLFVRESPRVSVPYPLSPRRHRFIHIGDGVRLHRREVSAMEDDEREDNGRLAIAVASSGVDALAAASTLHPLAPENVWVTGSLRNDLVLRDETCLPADLRAQEEALRVRLGDRRLVLFLPSEPGPGQAVPEYFTAEQVEWIRGWAERNGAVLGFRDHRTDRSRALSRLLRPVGALHLSNRDFPYDEVLHRVAAALITDHAEDALDFMATGKPVVSYVGSPDAAPGGRLLYDLDTILAGEVCVGFEALSAELETLFVSGRQAEGDSAALRRALLFDHLDDRNARRLVRRVKRLYVG